MATQLELQPGTAPRGQSAEQEYFSQYNIIAVLPAYNEAAHVRAVLSELPSYVRTIIVVDDASTDATVEVVQAVADQDPRIVLLRHDRNQGIGGAMVTGFQEALRREAQIVFKMDADGQMSVEQLPDLLRPLIWGEADYAKGNRFRDFDTLRNMPPLRRAGNMALSFLAKAAVGYWDCFDPCNGFIAINGQVLAQLPLRAINRSYFFETSMLAQLYLLGAVVLDVPMPARYGMEISHLSIRRVLFEFPPRMMAVFVRRIVLKNFIYDFSMESLYLLTGTPLLLLGILYGGFNWVRYSVLAVGAPTGTVVIPALLIIVGFQLLLSATGEDLRRTPSTPLCQGRLKRARQLTASSSVSGELPITP